MSRCFPFAPPGYEKTRNDNVESLLKEKHKEKKHKNEKDKEKKERKEKKDKDKDRSKDKHKEKKEKKEKARSKKKDKDREREKSTTTDERKSEGRSDDYTEEKPNESGCSFNGRMQTMVAEEPGKQIRDEAKLAGNPVFENCSAQVQRKTENLLGVLDHRRVGSLGRHLAKTGDLSKEWKGNHVLENSTAHAPRRMENMLAVPDKRRIESRGRELTKIGNLSNECKGNQLFEDCTALVQRNMQNVPGVLDQKRIGRPLERNGDVINDGKGNQVFENSTAQAQRRTENMQGAPDQRRIESIGRSIEKNGGLTNEWKDGKVSDDSMAQRWREKAETRINGNKMVQNATSTVQIAEKMGDQKNLGEKDKNKEKKSKGDDEKRNKHRHKEEKKSKRKDKEKEKEVGKANRKQEDSSKEQGKARDTQKEKVNTINTKPHLPASDDKDSEKNSQKEQIHTINIKPRFPSKESKEGAKDTDSENLRKRKDSETNGCIHENELRPNKMPRVAPSSETSVENVRNLEPSNLTIRPFTDRQGDTIIRKEEIIKESKVNGTIEAKPRVVTSKSRGPVEPLASEEVSIRPPHPDSLYLNQLLCIPKYVEWSDYDDQEWLFSSHSIGLKSDAATRVSALGASDAQQVWEKALRIESADVCALPYVIPY